MKDVRVNTAELKQRVTANRESHRKQFEIARAGWVKEVVQLMQADIEALQADGRRNLTKLDPQPEDHTSDYDRVLEMLAMSVDEQQVLDMATFRQYVLDDWSWKGHWTVSTSKYLASTPD